MFKENRTALQTGAGCASDEDCRSRAENDKDHIKSELLFARRPDLPAALTSVACPLILSTETARRSFETLTFFQKTTADISRLRACASWCPAMLARRGGLQTSSPKAFGISSDTRSVKRSTQCCPMPVCPAERSGQ